MSDAHKAALAVGRTEGKVVREYLEALRANKGTPGRKRTPESIDKRLKAIELNLQSANPMTELRLIQERLDLESERSAMEATVDLGAVEAAFIKIANSYSQRTGVSYKAWRAIGVSSAVLRAAGLKS